MAAHQAPLSLGFSRQEQWSGLPFPSPMHESEKWKWSRSVMSDSSRPHGLQPTRLLRPWDFPGKSTGVGCHYWSNRQIWLWSTKWSRAKANRVLPRECTGHSKHLLPTTQEKTLNRWSIPKSDWLYSLQPQMEKLCTVSQNKMRADCGSEHDSLFPNSDLNWRK